MAIEKYLEIMVKHEASDLFFSAGAPVGIKINGKTAYLNEQRLAGNDIRALAYSILDNEQVAEFENELELNLAQAFGDIGRFRINLFRQRGSVSMVVRHIKDVIPSIEELNLPPVLKHLVVEPRGLVLVVGATGSGKSTTLASMIDHRNKTETGHILTVEDPIEFLHKHEKSIVNQREVGLDTRSYGNALKNAMREAPDVILIGEIRDRDTMQQAIAYAETGHLCLATLHSSNANQTMDRVINFFPEAAHQQIFADLALHLRAIISLRLIADTEGNRIPATELLINTSYVSDLILKGNIPELKEAMKSGEQHGMQTFDQALLNLIKDGRVTVEEALLHADSKNDLRLAIRQEIGAHILPEVRKFR